MQKNASKEPVTSKSIQQQQPDPAEASNFRRQSIEAAAGPLRRSSIQSAMESDIRQPRLHQHRLSLGQIPQEDFSGAYARGSTQQVSHSRSSSGNAQSASAGGSPVSYGGTQGRAAIQRESTGGGSDSNSSSGGAPQGSDPKTMESERGRLNQLMTVRSPLLDDILGSSSQLTKSGFLQNFFLKFCLVIVRSRMDVPPVFARGTATRKVNKWACL